MAVEACVYEYIVLGKIEPDAVINKNLKHVIVLPSGSCTVMRCFFTLHSGGPTRRLQPFLEPAIRTTSSIFVNNPGEPLRAGLYFADL